MVTNTDRIWAQFADQTRIDTQWPAHRSLTQNFSLEPLVVIVFSYSRIDVVALL